jgi:NADPH:quinone reductase-like Zn-dependent oxidoreductase
VLVDPVIRNPDLPTHAQLDSYIGSERDGGFAQYVAVPAGNAHRIVTTLTDAELATFPCSYDTAEEMLVRADLRSGETIVVTGAAGGVGTALIQLARVRGARVIAVASAAKEDRIRALGADHFIARESAEQLAEVEAICGPRGVDVVGDVVGGERFADLLKMLRRAGRYTTAGAIAGPVQTIDLRDLIYKDLAMYGITCPQASTFARVVTLIEGGHIKPLLDQTFPLERLADAQDTLVRRSHVGKLVVIPS